VGSVSFAQKSEHGTDGGSRRVMEHFQWLTEAQSFSLAAENKSAVGEELADILLYLIRLSDKLGVDLQQAASHKLEKNAVKYPIEQVRGSAKKYLDY
jgi:dCTP diphosphatase